MSHRAEGHDNAARYAVMRYASEKDAVGKQYAGTWQQVVALLDKREIRPEKSGKAFAPVQMKAGATRSKDNVLAIYMAVADVDTEGEKEKASGRVLSVSKRAPTLEELRPRVQSYAWTAYSSHWHEPQQGVVKYRIVFPLTRPCTLAEWPQVWEGLNVLLGGHCDRACRDAARLYYLPSCPADAAADAFCETNDGKLLDPDTLIELARRSPTQQPVVRTDGNPQGLPALASLPETPEQIERVKAMLAMIPADCGYQQWRNIVWSIAATGWRCAEELAREWSQTAPQKFEESEYHNVYRSFKPGGGVGFRTLVYHAMCAGWVDSIGPGGASGLPGASSGDIRNGEEFAKLHRDKLLFVDETRDLLKFEAGTGWVVAPPGEADVAAKTVVKHLCVNATERWKAAPDDAQARRFMNEVQRSSRLQGVRAMIEMAKSEPGMTVRLHELDADPMLFGVRNGVLDLRTGKLRAPSPSLRVTKRCPVEYDPSATAPTFDAFIQRITRGTPALAPFLQRLAGYVLTGEVSEQCFAFLYGLGRNGKTTFAELLQWLLGDYAVPLPTATLMAEKTDPGAARPDLMLLKGRRLALASELEDGARFAEAAIKAMTGGDTMQARNPYGLYASWTPTHKLMLVGNHKPVISGSDYGMWRRVLLIPFAETIGDSERDDKLNEKLRREGAGVLNWALAGFRGWQQQGLNPPQAVKDAVAVYQSDMDILKQWMDDHVNPVAGAVTATADLYKAYSTWARDAGWKTPMTRIAFGRRLAERGIQLIKGGPGNTKCACGIALNNEGQKAMSRFY
ncbi:phage/plasmid primase, P4 family [Cupriavidus necator N-1]|uniref:Phage/plasmid primase, P4 family n=1 Tax=Cupriavidus necator (strain ATCC 43291 / DSM 13513 / CCUG 52238 / LMG 8453 / N-1) TaxID=1042878 RepID=G0EY09_CUPNN|nr:phage/plasmid primase, P4 family [Cupriavidus necator]AEI78622.1 phage/plasmid primase, P4 family [Cupriavidus necator N-1]MDX6012854.1 phage/plasmid primase, P4 family [Cupriavidus necator]